MGPEALALICNHGIRNNLNQDRKVEWRELHQLEIQCKMLSHGAWPLGLCNRKNSKTHCEN